MNLTQLPPLSADLKDPRGAGKIQAAEVQR